MSYRILDLRGLRIDRVEQAADRLVLHFDAANIEKIMDNAEQRTLWTQAGSLELVTTSSAALPAAPFVIARGDVEDGLYTQRDMIRIPLNASGAVGLSLHIEGADGPVDLKGSSVRLELEGNPAYVKHVD